MISTLYWKQEDVSPTAWISNNVSNRHILSIRASMAAVSTEFAWSESRHERSCAVQTTVTIGGVA